MKKALQREVDVAFSKQAQPLWFRIGKWIAFLGLLYLVWGKAYAWWVVTTLLVASIGIHLFYRYKTNGWTKSYGLWNYEKNKPKVG